jgi:Spy/CpxP family protein refolding chaperone
MCSFGKSSLTIAAFVLLAQAAPAQRFGGPGGGGPLQLLQNEGVQKELKMSEDQVKKVQEVGKEIREKHQDDFAKLQELDQSERQAKFQELMKSINEESTKALAGVLKPEQEKRLKQISRQAQGAQAFMDPEVQKALKITDEQKDKIKTITTDAGKEMREIFQNAGGDFQEAGKKMQALRKETLEKVTGLLTDEQKKSWKEMTGAPFELQFGPRRPRGGA